jgi:transposase
MSTRKLVITAVLAGSSQSEAARRYGVSQGWVSRLMARYATEGNAAFEARTRRPHTTPNVRHDRVSTAGTITLRHDGTLYRIGIGKTYARTYVLALVQDLDIRIIDAATGEILRDLTLDPTKIYQSTGRPPGPARK